MTTHGAFLMYIPTIPRAHWVASSHHKEKEEDRGEMTLTFQAACFNQSTSSFNFFFIYFIYDIVFIKDIST